MIGLTTKRNELLHIIEAHVCGTDECWDRILGSDFCKLRQKYQSQGFAGVSERLRNSLRQALSQQVTQADSRPFKVEFFERIRSGDSGRKLCKFVGMSGILVVACPPAKDTSNYVTVTAFFPARCRNWRDSARQLLLRYCKTDDDQGYIHPHEKKVFERNQIVAGRARTLWEDHINFISRKNFGLSDAGVVPQKRHFFPPWPGETVEEIPKRKSYSVRADYQRSDLKGGLD